MTLQSMGVEAKTRRPLPPINPEDIRAQPGPQQDFLTCDADVVVFGGAAGGSKTFSLLLDAARYVLVPGFSAVLFRRTYPEIVAPGGMWPESMGIYPHMRGKPNSTELTWKFPSGAVIKFAHLQYTWDVQKWLGSQITMIGFDQVEVFDEAQFWYMFSRNRSICGVRPYMRATANPEPGWLADLLDWWIGPDGYPIQERSGKKRWFIRVGNDLVWANNRRQLLEAHPGSLPKSFTFIPAKLTDNPILMQADPGYLANLEALPLIDRKRLKDGNWHISNADNEWPAEYFERILFDEWPAEVSNWVRVMALDPSKGSKDATGDYSCWISLAVDPERMTLWVDADMSNTRPVEPMPSNPEMRSIVFDGIEIYRKFRPVAVLVETNNFQMMVAQALLRCAMALGLPMPINTINHHEPKPQRIISALNAVLAQHRIRVKNSPGGRMLVSQMREFRRDQKDGVPVDGPDALATAIEMANEVLFGEQDDAIKSQINILEA
jgi:hypothetical protein